MRQMAYKDGYNHPQDIRKLLFDNIVTQQANVCKRVYGLRLGWSCLTVEHNRTRYSCREQFSIDMGE